jgi:hypothetical protein
MTGRGESLIWVMDGVERYGAKHGPARRIQRGVWTGVQITLLTVFAIPGSLRTPTTAWPFVAVPASLALLLAAWRWWSARVAARVAQQTPRPWESDRPWHRAGTPPRESACLLTIIGATAYGCIGWRVVGRLIGRGGGMGGDVLAALAAVGAAGIGVMSARAASNEPRVELLFDEFPLRTGSRIRLHVATSAGGPTLTTLCTALRAVRSPGTGWFGHPAPPAVVAIVEPAVEPAGTGPEEFVTLEFDIPADAPGTQLTPGDETHWELVVLGDTAHGPFSASVIVPIYAVDDGESRPTDPESGP